MATTSVNTNVNTVDPTTGVEVVRNRNHDNTEIIDGIRYTTEEDPNTLNNNDFLELMLTEMKMQDPTKPTDSAAMVDNQLKMSTIQANVDMTEAMASLKTSYSNSALSTAAGLIGKTIENGDIDDEGILKSFNVETVENIDGELYVNARQMTGVVDGMKSSEGDEIVKYDANGFFYPLGQEDVAEDEKIQYQLDLNEDGRFTYNEDGTIKMKDENGELITDEEILAKYELAGSAFTYADEQTKIPLSSILQVR